MEVEKRSSKGGFFQLFDWNGKSRKKLFSNKSELSESTDQGKENSDSARLQQMKLHQNGPSLSVRGSDYNCVSSVSRDEGCGTKPSGVVARLMGLDSLPTSEVSKPHFTPCFDSHSFRDSHLPRPSTDTQNEYNITDYGKTRNKLDGFSRNPVELRLQKLQNWPIERFQTEILPPKLARSISITHPRLFFPNKSPGFILTKNAACIMESAAKIIEQSPQSSTKGKLSSFRSPSVPLRIQDLKEKLEAAQKASKHPEASQRSAENRCAKFMRSERGRNRSDDSQLLNPSVVPKQGGSTSLKDKGKSSSLAIQEKTNVQRREGLALSGNMSSINQKADSRANSGHFDKKKLNIQKNGQKRTSAGGTSDVLKQNNQKQNCASSKERVNLKHNIASYQQDRKCLSANSSFRVNKTVNKIVQNSSIGTKKTNIVAADSGNERSSLKSKNFAGKKRVSGEVHYNGNLVDDVLINKNERFVKCNVSVDECTNWDAVDGKNGMDVISFTFASPIKKSLPGSQTSGQFMEKNNNVSLDPANDQPNSKISYLSSLGLNMIGNDALSVLLDQKLEELACRVEPSDCNLVKQGAFPTSTSILQESVPSPSVANSAEHQEIIQRGLPDYKPGNQHDSDCSSLDAKQKCQDSVELEESNKSNSNRNNIEYGKEFHCQYPIPVSTQSSFSGGSCILSDCTTSFTSNGNRPCSSPEGHETVSWISASKAQYVEDETELSDSAFSTPVRVMERKDIASTFWHSNFDRSSNCHLEYVKKVLTNAELMPEDFILDQEQEIITPDVFNQLEILNSGSDKTAEEHYKLERKLLFDCLSECLEFRCEWIFGGSYKSWNKLTAMFQGKERLADELYKEICGWTSMTDLMVDELVDKNMSTRYGKWVFFETEAFEEGAEIEKGILTSLVDDLVTDLFSQALPRCFSF